jgi:nucleoside-diphosphate-sugar epimerase
MKIVVTGGAGKLGRWLVCDLRSARHWVTVFDRARSTETADRTLLGDIENLSAVSAAFDGADAVIHLAGIPTHGIAADDVTFRINVVGTFNVHEAARVSGIRRIVTLSSEAVLGWAPGSWEREHVPAYLPIDEDHPCAPQDCYGLSKQVVEDIARSFTAKCGMETVLIRAPWIASPEELEQLAKSGGRTPSRFALYHYVDARDLAEACRLAVERPLHGSHTVYVGSGESTVAEPLSSLLPRLLPALGDKARALQGIRAAVSIERAKQLLGWEPKHSWRVLSCSRRRDVT